MYLQHLSLTNFRNYARLEIDLQARVHVLQGENAQGKTNLLEAIYYLATTKSPLAGADRQLLAWSAAEEVIPYARVEGAFTREGREHTIEVTLMLQRAPGQDLTTANLRKQIRLDGVPRRAMDVLGRLNVVLFLPEDIALVAGAPGERRRYLDATLCQIDTFYCRALSRYNRITTQRNALLKRLRERQASPRELGYWDQQLAEVGAHVLWRRLWASRELGAHASEYQLALTGAHETLQLVYASTVFSRLREAEGMDDAEIDALGDASRAEDLIEPIHRALRVVRREEVARGMTVVGPHRDDLRFVLNGFDATIYGSRGQQRTIALSLKLAEFDVMRDQTGEMPVLLLDDVASELDRSRCDFVLGVASRVEQVLLTTTNQGVFGQELLDKALLWRVIEGDLSADAMH